MASPPLTEKWVPLWPQGQAVPAPVEGKWLKAEGGSMLWKEVGAPNTLATLDANGKVPMTQLSGNVAGGVPVLDGAGKVTDAHLPARLGVSAETGFTDWNSCLSNGWYMSSTAANAPWGGWSLGEVFQHNGSWVTQRVWDFTHGPGSRIAERRKLNDAWSTWVDVGAPTYGPTFPAGPLNGTQHIYSPTWDGQNYMWHFRYNASSTHGYKWEFIGGAPYYSNHPGTIGVSGAGWVDHGGPQLYCHLTGEYDITLGCQFWDSSGGNNAQWMAFYIPSVAGPYAEMAYGAFAWTPNGTQGSRTFRHTGVAASWYFGTAYRTEGGTVLAAYRTLHVTPVRVA